MLMRERDVEMTGWIRGSETKPSNNYVNRCVNTLDCGRYVMRDEDTLIVEGM